MFTCKANYIAVYVLYIARRQKLFRGSKIALVFLVMVYIFIFYLLIQVL